MPAQSCHTACQLYTPTLADRYNQKFLFAEVNFIYVTSDANDF